MDHGVGGAGGAARHSSRPSRGGRTGQGHMQLYSPGDLVTSCPCTGPSTYNHIGKLLHSVAAGSRPRGTQDSVLEEAALGLVQPLRPISQDYTLHAAVAPCLANVISRTSSGLDMQYLDDSQEKELLAAACKVHGRVQRPQPSARIRFLELVRFPIEECNEEKSRTNPAGPTRYGGSSVQVQPEDDERDDDEEAYHRCSEGARPCGRVLEEGPPMLNSC